MQRWYNFTQLQRARRPHLLSVIWSLFFVDDSYMLRVFLNIYTDQRWAQDNFLCPILHCRTERLLMFIIILQNRYPIVNHLPMYLFHFALKWHATNFFLNNKSLKTNAKKILPSSSELSWVFFCINSYTSENYFAPLVEVCGIKWIDQAMSDEDWSYFCRFKKKNWINC